MLVYGTLGLELIKRCREAKSANMWCMTELKILSKQHSTHSLLLSTCKSSEWLTDNDMN